MIFPFDKILHPFIKTLKKLAKKEHISKFKKPYMTSPQNIIFNSARLKDYTLRSETRQRCSFLPFLFNKVLEALARAIRQEK